LVISEATRRPHGLGVLDRFLKTFVEGLFRRKGHQIFGVVLTRDSAEKLSNDAVSDASTKLESRQTVVVELHAGTDANRDDDVAFARH